MSKRRESAGSNRRNFLKGAGLVGAAAAVAPPVAAHAMPAAPLEKAKVGLASRTRSGPESPEPRIPQLAQVRGYSLRSE